ncbi:MAG TPA: hypothetical protein VFU41_06800 [Gemmatimonadales bacterium]|nr:hypothetical protein [Gemmatimonadales bacterium]
MPHAAINLVRLLTIAGAVLAPGAGAACAGRPAESADVAFLRPWGPATLRVTNANWSEVRIYLVRAGAQLRLGSVTSNGTAVFEIPSDYLGQSGSVTLVANPVAGRASYSTALTGISPGDELELFVENLLQFSHLVVR